MNLQGAFWPLNKLQQIYIQIHKYFSNSQLKHKLCFEEKNRSQIVVMFQHISNSLQQKERFLQDLTLSLYLGPAMPTLQVCLHGTESCTALKYGRRCKLSQIVRC